MVSGVESSALYIAVEGPIGVGKTTLTEMLAERMNARLVLEKFEENPFLADFYSDRDRYAFQTQIFFLMSRFKQQAELLQPDLFQPHLVSDYHLLKDRIFAQLTLRDDELALYEQVHRALQSQILQPDVVVFLRAQQNVLLRRIETRGRSFEADFDREYLLGLSRNYDDFFARYDRTPLLTVDTSEINVFEHPEAVDDILGDVRELAARARRVAS